MSGGEAKGGENSASSPNISKSGKCEEESPLELEELLELEEPKPLRLMTSPSVALWVLDDAY